MSGCLIGDLLQQTSIYAFLKIRWKSRFVCDLEDFYCLHSEILRAREIVHDGSVVCLCAATTASVDVSITASVCVTVLRNSDDATAAKCLVPFVSGPDWPFRLFCPQREFPRGFVSVK
jgi:hypothetical protein